MTIAFRYIENGREREAVQPLEDGPRQVRAFALNNDLTARDWIAAEVRADSGEVVARLAFNGKEYE